jgi:pyroglutamyl-peptidase
MAEANGTVLLTGFEPFGGETLNPSWLAVKALHGRKMLGRTVVAAQLPTVFDASLSVLNRLLREHSPNWWCAWGRRAGATRCRSSAWPST